MSEAVPGSSPKQWCVLNSVFDEHDGSTRLPRRFKGALRATLALQGHELPETVTRTKDSRGAAPSDNTMSRHLHDKQRFVNVPRAVIQDLANATQLANEVQVVTNAV
eukprot:6471600-Amphidinium_carterae.2